REPGGGGGAEEDPGGGRRHPRRRHALQRGPRAQLLQRRARRRAPWYSRAAHRPRHRQPRGVRRHARSRARGEAADGARGAMICGVGTDVVEIGRIEAALKRYGERFAKRVLCPPELERFHRHRLPASYLAKRFAAKEAFTKALGTGIRAPANWH